ncbi:MAG: hypothetical protein ACRCUB_10895 [Plesiomonas shigelloides]
MMMQKCVYGLSLALLLSTSAHANILNRDCTMEKATRNAAMEATLGVSGNCTVEKALKEQAGKAVGWDEKKDALNNTQERIKDSKQALNHDIRTAKERVNNTRNSIEDAIQHPEKAIIKQALK